MTSIFLFLALAFAKEDLVDKILVIVSDQVITKSDVLAYKQSLINGASIDDLFDVSSKDLLANEEKLLKHLIDEKILEVEIKRANLMVTREAVEEEIDRISRRNRINREQLSLALQEQGMTYSEYFNFIKNRIERQSLIQQSITSRIRISDEDIQSYYLKHYGSEAKNIFEYTLSHILIRDRPGAEEQIKEIHNRLSEGAAFENLVSQVSEDPNFAAGGLLGKFKSGEMAREIESAIQDKSSGDISPPIKTAMGWHIIRIVEKRLIPNPELLARREQIRNILTNEALRDQFRFWLDQKRAETYIKHNT